MSDRVDEIFAEVKAEIERAQKLHPDWPSDLIHAAAIVSEEAGELVKAVNDYAWCKTDTREAIRALRAEARKEAIHTAATAIRFLINLEVTKAEAANVRLEEIINYIIGQNLKHCPPAVRNYCRKIEEKAANKETTDG